VNGTSIRDLFRIEAQIIPQSESEYTMHVGGELLFSNILGFKNKFSELPKGKNVLIDVSDTRIIDHTSFVTLNGLMEDYKINGGSAVLIGLENHRQLGHAPTSARVLKVKQAKLKNINPSY
jgi:anti-anti-sigma regulatory factor